MRNEAGNEAGTTAGTEPGGAAEARRRPARKVREGTVVSNKMDKTVVIEQRRRVPHPVYKRYITLTKKYYAQDDKNECQIGDFVRIMETRPLSKLKRWRVVEVIEKSKA
ncbi:MAG: 30S ribosomal protein S17 [Candidatus Eisenbacteria bacterium]|nr:30S ribosomal protein S17 [Candidatus Eisenbacteria bacterium]